MLVVPHPAALKIRKLDCACDYKLSCGRSEQSSDGTGVFISQAVGTMRLLAGFLSAQ